MKKRNQGDVDGDENDARYDDDEEEKRADDE
jgi:hypothetical protein